MLKGVQAASVATNDDGDLYRVELDTADGQVPLHNISYNMGLERHPRLAERVNAFLQDPTVESMTIDPGLGTRLGPALISLVIGAALLFGTFAELQSFTLQDDFSTNDYDWPIGLDESENSDRTTALVDGRYRMSVTARDDSFRYVTTAVPAADVRFMLDVTLVEASGGQVGDTNIFLIVRRNPDKDYYRIRFYDDNSVKVSLRRDGKWITIFDRTNSEAIQLEPGVSNTFGVEIVGPNMTIYANGQQIATLTDATLLEAGKIGMGIGLANAGQSATVDFDNLQVEAIAAGDE